MNYMCRDTGIFEIRKDISNGRETECDIYVTFGYICVYISKCGKLLMVGREIQMQMGAIEPFVQKAAA